MNRFTWVVMASLLATVALGCNGKKANDEAKPTTGSTGVIAVIDLNRALVEVGIQAKLQEYLNKAVQDGRKALADKRAPMDEILETRRGEARKYFNTLTDEQKKEENLKKDPKWEEFRKPIQEQAEAIQKEVNAHEEVLAKYKQQLNEEVQRILLPALSAVATTNNARLLVPKTSTLYVDPDADLTNKLVAYLTTNPPKPLQPPPVPADWRVGSP